MIDCLSLTYRISYLLQFGFRKSHATCMVPVSMLNKLHHPMGKGLGYQYFY